MITIDGSHGEGGGQILRTSLALAIISRQPVKIVRIRAGRSRPGLQRQHLAAVHAAATISGADLSGAELNSQKLEFRPGAVRPGDYRFDIGSAGSTTLVLQTVLPPLMLAEAPSALVLEGGTHNPWAPAYESLAESFLPVLRQMGPEVTTVLEAPGFAPAGRGRLAVSIVPANSLTPLHLESRGDIRRTWAEALVARLPPSIAERELKVLKERLGWADDSLHIRQVTNSAGPGNIVIARVESEHVVEVAVCPGQKGIPAEHVAADVAGQIERYLAADVPVGEHLADQLLLPFALAGGGSFVTMPLTEHSRTNIEIIGEFLPVTFTIEEAGPAKVRVAVEGS